MVHDSRCGSPVQTLTDKFFDELRALRPLSSTGREVASLSNCIGKIDEPENGLETSN